jgi:hypothetical protein
MALFASKMMKLLLLPVLFAFLRPSDLDLKAAEAKLYRGFYKNSCPEAESLVTSVLLKAVQREPRNAASVLRFQFHDCFVNVCRNKLIPDRPLLSPLSFWNEFSVVVVIFIDRVVMDRCCWTTLLRWWERKLLSPT